MHLDVLTKTGKELLPALKKFSGFHLAGGTALALQIGHRISVDFDLFSEKPLSRDLYGLVKRVFRERTIRPSVNTPEELTVFIDGTKLTFLEYPFPLIRKVIFYQEIPFLSIKEIGATKAYTIGRRGAWKDYIDLFFILHERYGTLDQIIRLAQKKFDQEFNVRLFFEQLMYVEDVPQTPLKFLQPEPSQAAVLQYFEKEIRKFKL